MSYVFHNDINTNLGGAFDQQLTSMLIDAEQRDRRKKQHDHQLFLSNTINHQQSPPLSSLFTMVKTVQTMDRQLAIGPSHERTPRYYIITTAKEQNSLYERCNRL